MLRGWREWLVQNGEDVDYPVDTYLSMGKRETPFSAL
jgi:hypothetical protein